MSGPKHTPTPARDAALHKAWVEHPELDNEERSAFIYGFEAGWNAAATPEDHAVIARDDTAELVEAVDTFLSRLEDFLGATIADESVSLVARRQFERLHALLDDSLADAREALTLTPNETGFLVVEAWENGNRPNIPAYGAAAARLVTSGGKLRAVLARAKGET